ncbi:MAG TPA: hypothetical protein VFA55_10560, partial [Candidatus Kapabacteria bacterium]|nr:hypothetical protein [Candidatus Kapabacteria bacterium]
YTLNGTQQFQQDLFILENNPEFSLRARYSQNRSLTQYATTDEQAYQSEQSLRIRWHLVQEITSEIDVARNRDNLSAIGASVNTPRQLTTDMFQSDLSYRPVQDIEAGWMLTLKTTTDASVAPNVSANKDYNNIHVTYSFTGRGQLRGEVERDEVILGPTPLGYASSFQLTDGFSAGQTYIARATFEYRVTANVQASATYIGRLHESSLPVHTFQAEVRALF